MDFYSTSTHDSYASGYADDLQDQNPAAKPLTAEDVAVIVNGALASLKVYVVESDITSAQNSVRAVVEQATF